MRGKNAGTAPLPVLLMLALTFSTGIIDAVGYLGLDRVFTGNMTGNVVILGMALAGGDGLPVLGPTIALGGFMVGAALGGRYLRTVPTEWGRRHSVAFGVVGIMLVLIAGVLLTTGSPRTDAGHDSQTLALGITGLMAASMGLQAAAARRLGLKDLTTVVVTSVITGLSADSRLGGGHGQQWERRTAAIVLIAAGAATGALLLRWHLGFGVLLAGVIALIVAVLGDTYLRTQSS